MKLFFVILGLLSNFLFKSQVFCQQDTIKKGNVIYDFTLAELSVEYMETADSSVLTKIVNTEGFKLIYEHASWSGNNSDQLSKTEFAKKIIDRDNKKNDLNIIRKNLSYAWDSIAATDYPQPICLEYLPTGFSFSSRLCFTIGYDLGIVYLNNSSLNISNMHYLNNVSELKYYAIHELHHAGFVILKKNFMPALGISTFGQMQKLIAYFTHLEGMAVYAAFDTRMKNNALNNDQDYVALQDTALMTKYCSRYFEIYNHFKNNPEDTLTEKDWQMLCELSSNNRLWYRVGALMAMEIDRNSGRVALTNLIAQPSENFINAFLDDRKSIFH